jgi:hypothetical protein
VQQLVGWVNAVHIIHAVSCRVVSHHVTTGQSGDPGTSSSSSSSSSVLRECVSVDVEGPEGGEPGTVTEVAVEASLVGIHTHKHTIPHPTPPTDRPLPSPLLLCCVVLCCVR